MLLFNFYPAYSCPILTSLYSLKMRIIFSVADPQVQPADSLKSLDNSLSKDANGSPSKTPRQWSHASSQGYAI